MIVDTYITDYYLNKSIIKFYLKKGLSDLSLKLIEPTSVNLSWQVVDKQNGFQIKYLLFRRLSCIASIPRSIPCPSGKICCGPNIFEPLAGYQCCSNFFYIPLKEDEICCGSNSEFGYNIGRGNECCADLPFVNTSTQYCCNSELKNEFADRTRHCPLFPHMPGLCQQFELLSTQNLTYYLDTGLNSSTLYEYKLCAENSFGQTCSNQMYTIKTNVTKPQIFTKFNFRQVSDESILLFWDIPLRPNDFSVYFILSRNLTEIYRGNMRQFDDKNLNKNQKFIYSIKVCNSAGCITNSNKLIFIGKTTRPGPIQIISTSKTSTNINIKFSLQDIVKKIVLIIHKIDLEVEFYFSFESNKTSITIPAFDYTQPLIFSSHVFIEDNLSLSTNVVNLEPNTDYEFEFLACNELGCSEPTISHVTTSSDKITNFKKPVLFALNESVIEIVWWEPELNGNLAYYKIYRNGALILTTEESNRDFYAYKDTGLEANRLYKYTIEVSNGYFQLESSSVQIRTPVDSKFFRCSTNNVQYPNSINLENLLRVNLSQVSSNFLTLAYNNSDWQNFISCIQPSVSFSIRIILLSQEKRSQSLKFPFPVLNRSVTWFNISGLGSNTNYSLRLIITSSFPQNRALISEAVFVRTRSAAVKFGLINYAIKPHTNQVSIRWTIENAAMVDTFQIIWTKSNCTNQIFENMTINSIDKTNKFLFVKRDILDEFIFNLIKVIAVNEDGISESPVLNFSTAGSRPMSVSNLRITQVFSTGLKISFNNKNFYLSHFIVLSESIYSKLNRSLVILPVDTACRVNSTYEAVINGLMSYTMYNVTVSAVSFSGLESRSDEFLLVNTLESTPRMLRPLVFESFSDKILVKFTEPDQLNGLLVRFNLYMDNKIVFSGKNRDFLVVNLEPFTNYTFEYEVCTNMGCSRFINKTIIRTEQAIPSGLEPPNVKKTNGCFLVEINLPSRMNGVYR